MKYQIDIHGRSAVVDVQPLSDGRVRVTVDDGPARVVSADQIGAAEWLLRDDGGTRKVAVHVTGERVAAQVGGCGVFGTVVDPRSSAHHGEAAAAAGSVRSPMPGAVGRVLVKVGDAVVKGQVLVVVEAMKMENEFRSPCDGVVAEVGVQTGNTVESGALLVTVTPQVGVA